MIVINFINFFLFYFFLTFFSVGILLFFILQVLNLNAVRPVPLFGSSHYFHALNWKTHNCITFSWYLFPLLITRLAQANLFPNFLAMSFWKPLMEHHKVFVTQLTLSYKIFVTQSFFQYHTGFQNQDAKCIPSVCYLHLSGGPGW